MMNTTKIAVQFYTLRDHARNLKEFVRSCEKISKIGYSAVQMSGVAALDHDVTVKEARKILDDYGLRCIATHRPWERFVNNRCEEIEFHKTLGCNYAAIGGLWSPYRNDSDSYRRFIIESAPVIDDLAAEGIRFGYHNHSHEFQRIGEGALTLYDLLIDEGPKNLMLEVDTHWVAHAGLCPTVLINRCKGRIPVIHLKDTEVVEGIGPVMAPIGEGNLNWPSIISACESGGAESYAIEQDTCRRDPFDCLRSSFEYLKDLQL
jgi:sugar phosphate isomerase/epimerase